jgi:hypothetical protein
MYCHKTGKARAGKKETDGSFNGKRRDRGQAFKLWAQKEFCNHFSEARRYANESASNISFYGQGTSARRS